MQLPTFSTVLLSSFSLITFHQALAQGSPDTPICPYTIDRLNVIDLSPTTTVWVHTATHTNTVDCQGCTTVVVDYVGGPGPERPPFTATVTDSEGTTLIEAYTCSPTPTTTITAALRPRTETTISGCTSTTSTYATCPPIIRYGATATQTSTLDCGGCSSLAMVPVFVGVGHVCPLAAAFSIVEPTTTTTAYVCSTTIPAPGP